jgi:molybdopterin converting factor small subunit
MKQINTKIYSFSELSATAQEKAKADYRDEKEAETLQRVYADFQENPGDYPRNKFLREISIDLIQYDNKIQSVHFMEHDLDEEISQEWAKKHGLQEKESKQIESIHFFHKDEGFTIQLKKKDSEYSAEFKETLNAVCDKMKKEVEKYKTKLKEESNGYWQNQLSDEALVEDFVEWDYHFYESGKRYIE